MANCSYYLLQLGENLQAQADVIGAVPKGQGKKYTAGGGFESVPDDNGEVAVKGLVFYSQESRGAPGWYQLFRSLTEEEYEGLYPGASHSGVLLVEAVDRVWALAFGGAFRDVEELSVEMRFGRITLSNAIDDIEKLRGFVAQSFGKFAKVRIEATTRDGPIERLSFMEQSNRLRKIRARITVGGEDHTLEGGISLRFPQPSDFDQLAEYLTQLLEWWNEGKELNDEIAAKDPVYEIAEPKRIEAYEAEFEARLRAGDTAPFYLSLDGERLWSADSYSLKLGRNVVADLAWLEPDYIVNTVRAHVDHESDQHRLRLELVTDGQTEAVDLRKVLSYERPQGEREYFVVVRDSGKWWEYRESWVIGIEDRFKRNAQSSDQILAGRQDKLTHFRRKDFKGRDPEAEWIKLQRTANPGSVVLHLVSLIRIEGAKSPVELADFYWKDVGLFGIKRGVSLDRIDEVAGQVEAAAKMLSTQPEFVSKAQSKCDELKVGLHLAERTSYAFGCISFGNPAKLSIRGRERMNLFFSRMAEMNFRPCWIFVEEVA